MTAPHPSPPGRVRGVAREGGGGRGAAKRGTHALRTAVDQMHATAWCKVGERII